MNSSTMASLTNGFNSSGNRQEEDGAIPEVASAPSLHAEPEEIERKARVDAVWQQMNKGVSTKTLKSISNKHSSTVNKTTQNGSASWMSFLGLAKTKAALPQQDKREKQPNHKQNSISDEEAKKLAAAALSAVEDAAALAAASEKGKLEISEVRGLVGHDTEGKKLIGNSPKETYEKAKAPVSAPSAVDAVLEQIKKKQKLSVLDKTKKDWGEYKEENKGLEDELEAYKKSSNQYLERVSFLQRADYREFERERDVRLAMQAKRKADMREDP
ncbi:uncharacterized protein LOC127811923 isoform X2 [Diospyros lotus]|uniref:uncharacterized protein LOC127811923 isoform X2 n=1 Tax=Diospyros lotus TaxID=55363 RepID=UPI00224F63E0|nr:uncharacterized protein LOC127811923 isoform X2 [Diospyros lotus]